jgi:hypothetical protein
MTNRVMAVLGCFLFVAGCGDNLFEETNGYAPGAPLGGGGAGGAGGLGSAGAGGMCVGPLGAPRDPAGLPACCMEDRGQAHCVDTATIPASLQAQVAACPAGGSCVPDKLIRTGGVFTPKTCKSLADAPGVCLSICIPQVSMNGAILPKDVCDEDEKCVPCISPLDMKSTGACDLKGECNGATGAAGSSGAAGAGGDSGATSGGAGTGPGCVHQGAPLIDPAALPACQPGAHCLAEGLVPMEFRARLARCTDMAQLCVPDTFIRTGGKFQAPPCRSLGDSEGRCLPKALPEVTAQASSLPQATCDATEACVPCFNPANGMDTGACRLSCDSGPTEPARMLAKCCGGIGSCVPVASVPMSQAGRLAEDTCTPGQNLLCAPDQFINRTPIQTCDTGVVGIIFPQARMGACLAECLPEVKGLSFALQQGVCGESQKCVPCTNPLNNMPTGACTPLP